MGERWRGGKKKAKREINWKEAMVIGPSEKAPEKKPRKAEKVPRLNREEKRFSTSFRESGREKKSPSRVFPEKKKEHQNMKLFFFHFFSSPFQRCCSSNLAVVNHANTGTVVALLEVNRGSSSNLGSDAESISHGAVALEAVDDNLGLLGGVALEGDGADEGAGSGRVVPRNVNTDRGPGERGGDGEDVDPALRVGSRVPDGEAGREVNFELAAVAVRGSVELGKHVPPVVPVGLLGDDEAGQVRGDRLGLVNPGNGRGCGLAGPGHDGAGVNGSGCGGHEDGGRAEDGGDQGSEAHVDCWLGLVGKRLER